jgi:hypothetical protein
MEKFLYKIIDFIRIQRMKKTLKKMKKKFEKCYKY